MLSIPPTDEYSDMPSAVHRRPTRALPTRRPETEELELFSLTSTEKSPTLHITERLLGRGACLCTQRRPQTAPRIRRRQTTD